MKIIRKSAILFLTLLAFEVISGCGKELTRTEKRSAINVTVRTVDTKATAITNDNFLISDGFMMQGFVDAYNEKVDEDPNHDIPHDAGRYFNTKVQYKGARWSLIDEEFWIDKVYTYFWCYAPVNPEVTSRMNFTAWDAAAFDAEERSFSYTVPSTSSTEDADAGSDLIFAFKKQKYTGNETTDLVNLTFHHALSQVEFCVSPDDGTFDTSLKINSISLVNFPTTGTCTVKAIDDGGNPEDYFTWSGLGTPASLDQEYNATFATQPANWSASDFTVSTETMTLYSTDNTFFVIPCPLDGTGNVEGTANSGPQIKVIFEGDGQEITRYLPLNSTTTGKETLLPGYYYKFKIDATVIGRTIKFGVTLTDWVDVDDKMYIE